MPSIAPLPKFRFFTEGSAGQPVRPLVGGKVYFYEAGTTTPKDTYTDSTGLVTNTNPVILNARGEANIWLGDGSYKMLVTDADGVAQGGAVDGIRGLDDLQAYVDALRADLANAADADKGLNLTGYTRGLAYDAGTGGNALNQLFDYIDDLQQFVVADADTIQSVVTDLAAGTARTIACFGDSTMWGADPAILSNQVAVTPPTALANLVNTYHGNSALTVTNNALGGTTATQMIAGTDGSGSTFAAKMAASPASIVYCNHGINDAFGVNATTVAQYKTALLAFVYTCRFYGKTPVLVTPFPALTFGTFGSQARAEATSRFAEQMRKVASDHGVTLIDNNLTLSRVLGVDGYLPLTILPDGVHASQVGYILAGNNLARALLEAQAETFTRPGQRLPSSASAVKATSQTVSASGTSRVGVVVTTGTVATQSMRMVFLVDEPGLDISFSHPIFSSGCATIAINLDGTNVGTLSQFSTNFNVSFLQDFETVIARNIPPGLHILIMTTTGVGGIGLHCLRSREASKPLLLPNGSANPGQMRLMAPKLELTSGVANTMFVCDDIPVGGFLDACSFEWTGQMLKDSGVIIGGNLGSNAGPAACERVVGVILQAGTGFLAVIEATAPATYTTTVLGAADLSLASHLFRFTLTTAGQLTVYVDGVQIGAPVALTGPWRGGLLGLWKNSNTGALTVTDVTRVWGL